MSKYSGAHDVYKELVQDSEENWLYGLVAFAVVEEQRVEWMNHIKENTGQFPSHDEITEWYEQQPEGVILRAKGTAESALKTYSEEVVELINEDNVREIEEGIIVKEIQSLKRFWPQFGVNLAGGFVSTLVFAALLILFTFFVLYDSSPVDIGKQLFNSIED
ncbi:hypothetical protein A3194_12635 [Candidatus Thiodiazotropha endoloripes]|uniref:hypothetical protein n=1 Tax=Candidatus Thiodiazotropha endoloripes TaxID=1818881 RepID=UPI00083CB867|nr:hypothetical protein [Candidatus Thiodiazotropha endoloripes]ODB85942.1 hypothetical protein A3194_12635 [Candidatus Thiodiazotropha endoloripes]